MKGYELNLIWAILVILLFIGLATMAIAIFWPSSITSAQNLAGEISQGIWGLFGR